MRGLIGGRLLNKLIQDGRRISDGHSVYEKGAASDPSIETTAASGPEDMERQKEAENSSKDGNEEHIIQEAIGAVPRNESADSRFGKPRCGNPPGESKGDKA